MWERFTEKAKRVVSVARDVAGRVGSEYVRTEHVLLAVCKVSDGTGAKILQALGVDLNALAAGIEHEMPVLSPSNTELLTFTPEAKKVLEVAVEEVRRYRDGYIGSEHILLGLINVGGPVVSGKLEQLNIDAERVNRIRQEHMDLFRQEV